MALDVKYGSERMEGIFYLMTHSVHFNCDYMALDIIWFRKDGRNILFNHTLNTF